MRDFDIDDVDRSTETRHFINGGKRSRDGHKVRYCILSKVEIIIKFTEPEAP